MENKIKKVLSCILILYAVLAVAFYYLAGEQLKYKEAVEKIAMPEADSVTDEIVKGMDVRQEFVNTVDRIESATLVFTKFYREGSGNLVIDLLEGDRVLMREILNIDEIPEQGSVVLRADRPIEDMKGKRLSFRLYSNTEENRSLAAMMTKENVLSDSRLYVNGEPCEGMLCFSVDGTQIIHANRYYWFIALGVGLILAAILYSSYRSYVRNNRANYLIRSILAVFQYSFLISQLISRDFKSKYKRSVLGVFWSFLNPLLTMIVQFLVFSTFFKADTKNYPVYLLSGVVCFNFFKETTDMCLSSISGNANLINKVYIPKYIFPMAKTMSSTINLGISLIPLLLVSLLMGVTFHKSLLLMFYFLACLIVFSLGFGLLLSAFMVFFRDIQFLWGVIVQIWQYATPIFYPAEIVPDRFRFIIRLNPLYHFIGNLRKCLIDGISPEPMAYIYCLVFALVSLLAGLFVFKKTQDKFTLYL
ncbi:MAG: ABC transporter permease [Erysipelotrichaceae bacterium]|nr:ABC transporter permease [Erysipelotrichaceae bacterium]